MEKIIHWIPCSNLGGCEILLQTFLQGSENIENIILTCKPGPAILLWEKCNAKVFFIPEWSKKNPLHWAKKIRNTLSMYDLFYFIAWSPSRLSFLRWSLKGNNNVKSIIHIGNRVDTSIINTIRFKLIDFILKVQHQNNTVLVGCSHYVENTLKSDRYFCQFNSVGILNGVRNVFFNNGIQISNNYLKLCTVGRLDPMKRHSMMLEMIKGAIDKGINLTFDIFGEGSERNLLYRKICTLNLNDIVYLRGNKSNIHVELQDKNIFIFNSTPLEGMGIALAEAMSLGLICVVNNSSLMRELLGETGFYFSTKEEFIKILEMLSSDKKLFSYYSFRTIERAKRIFSPVVFTKRYLDLLGLSNLSNESYNNNYNIQ